MNFSPFDGRKVAYHLPYWAQMADGKIPPPVLVTIDPINACNLGCTWCNAAAQMAQSSDRLDDETVEHLPRFLAAWGVRAVCIAGGGEPLMHPRASDLINGLVDAGLEVGVVTNGHLVDRHLDALAGCRWVGVSVDAGTQSTYRDAKGADLSRVTANIRALVGYAREVTFKYLLHPSNLGDIEVAVDLAQSMGCTYFHIRPAGRTWEEVQRGQRAPLFSAGQVDEALCRIRFAGERCRPGFLQATLGKFGGAWDIVHRFSQCWAVGMTCVLQPDKTVGLCCDRRGDWKTTLVRWDSLHDISTAWNASKHWDLMKGIRLTDCPRCTYSPHNEAFEAFVVSDLTCRNFI